ncbi:MAG: PELO-like protein [Promethearchaeota archaeon]|nr:MAG: PELO-like protein [Candidatus Lokiarchaeota archaeon]
MKIIAQDTKKREITVKVENLNDLWTLYNVISQGDEVSTLTQRRVVMREGSAGERKVMKLTLSVEAVSFHEFTNRLRIKGTILEGPKEYVSYGSYHTFNIELYNELTITKEQWLTQDLKRLKESSMLSSNFVMLIISIESGLATIAYSTNYSYKKLASVSKNIPGKRYEQSFRKKFLYDFFEDIKRIIDTKMQNKEVNLIILCGPGTVKNKFQNYLRENTHLDYLNKIKVIQASSGTESAIYEALKSDEMENLKERAKILQETRKIEEIMAQFGKDPDLVAIGTEEIQQAAQRGAIEQLLVADTMIRGASKAHKLQIEDILKQVEYSGGKIDILNSKHPAGERLIDLGSIVGILRYKL